MTFDRYTKLILTVIAVALVVVALNPWLQRVRWDEAVGVRASEAQTPATPIPPPVAPVPSSAAPATPPSVPGAQPAQAPIPVPPINTPWWDDCALVSQEAVPANWGKLQGLAPGLFVFESDDTIRLARTAPFEAVVYDPSKKPCKVLEIKKAK